MNRGGSNDKRFDGYGNVQVEPGRPVRGWQLTCSECGGRSEIRCHKGKSYPPKMLYRLFRQEGWRLNSNPAHDVCPRCQEKVRDKRKEERQQYVNGSADRLIEGIRLVDKLMTASVTAEYGTRQPDVAAAMKSLIETAYLCNMLTREDIPPDVRPSTPPEPPKPVMPTLEDVWKQVSVEERADFMLKMRWKDGRNVFTRNEIIPEDVEDVPSNLASMPTHAPLPENTQPAALVDEPPPEPKPEPEKMHARTAAYLDQMRKAILGSAHK